MNASRDPWTDDEIRAAITTADAEGGPPIELLTHFISLFQRATVALESIATACVEPEVLFEEVPHKPRVNVGDEPENDGLGGLMSEDHKKH